MATTTAPSGEFTSLPPVPLALHPVTVSVEVVSETLFDPTGHPLFVVWLVWVVAPQPAQKLLKSAFAGKG